MVNDCAAAGVAAEIVMMQRRAKKLTKLINVDRERIFAVNTPWAAQESGLNSAAT